jgi:hypothetical protein
MEHYFENIHGYFNFNHLYDEMVEKYSSGSHFVEVGCWLGRSAVYLGVEIVNSGKDIKLDCIDTWSTSEDPGLIDEPPIKNGTLYADFLKNVEPLESVIKPIQMRSDEAYKLYEDESLEFVYIDADHSKKGIRADLNNWFPKVKKSGVLAGHDYDHPAIREELENFFTNKDYEVRGCSSWVHYKK